MDNVEDMPMWEPTPQILGHEKAVTASFASSVRLPFPEICLQLADGMRALADWVWEQGGVVGHVKAAVQAPDGQVRMYSLTDREPQGKTTAASQDSASEEASDMCQLHLAAIVFFVEERALQHRLRQLGQSLGALPSDRGGQEAFSKESCKKILYKQHGKEQPAK